MRFVVYFILVICFTICNCDDKSTVCSTWEDIEESLKVPGRRIECTRNENCSGMNCSAFAFGYDVHSGIQIVACEEKPSLEFSIEVPKLNISYMKKRVYNGDSITLKENLQLEFQIQQEEKKIFVRVIAHYVDRSAHSILRTPVNIPVFRRVGFPVDCALFGESSSTVISKNISVTILPSLKPNLLASRGFPQIQGNCTITNSSCIKNELCQQLNKSRPDGVCICLSNYVRNEEGVCVYDPPADTSSEGPTSTPESDDKEKSKAISLLLTATLVPLTVILVIVGLVTATIRFRIFQHLRRRLRVQVYEHVLLGQDDDNEEESSNPIA